MVFDYEADCSYNTKMLLLPYTSNCRECGRNFGRQAVREGLCAAITFPFSSSARIGIIFPFSSQSAPLSALSGPSSFSSLCFSSLKTPFSFQWVALPSHCIFYNDVELENAWCHWGRPAPKVREKWEMIVNASISEGKTFLINYILPWELSL